MTTIREAREGDEEEVLEMVRAFIDTEAKLPQICGSVFNPLAVASFIGELIRNDELLLLVAEGEDKLLGTVAAIPSPFWWNPLERMFQEAWWWIHPEARGSGVGRKLLEVLEMHAAERGFDRMAMNTLAGSPAAAGSGLEKAGYQQLEVTWTKRLGVRTEGQV